MEMVLNARRLATSEFESMCRARRGFKKSMLSIPRGQSSRREPKAKTHRMEKVRREPHLPASEFSLSPLGVSPRSQFFFTFLAYFVG
jgi:hypothetical protein